MPLATPAAADVTIKDSVYCDAALRLRAMISGVTTLSARAITR